jgi:cobalamin biosynthetic protein CobC
MKQLKHGGNVSQWAERSNTVVEQWLDLSTGVSPNGYPVDGIPAAVFHHLPDGAAMLLTAAKQYYQSDNIVAVNGSQQAIEMLPKLIAPLRVALPDVGYQEHAYRWQLAGHSPIWYSGFEPKQLQQLIDSVQVDAAVLINPNNPTGARVEVEQILSWAATFAERGGVLIVDEAFIDLTPEHSVSALSGRPGLVVLRSVGKFFGLAGLRVGFVMAETSLLNRMQAQLSPWQINGPAEYLLTRALADSAWQQQQRVSIEASSLLMANLLQQYFPGEFSASGLFLTATMDRDRANALFDHLLAQHILVRVGVVNKCYRFIRFGLIDADDAPKRNRLTHALAGFRSPGLPPEVTMLCDVAN